MDNNLFDTSRSMSALSAAMSADNQMTTLSSFNLKIKPADGAVKIYKKKVKSKKLSIEKNSIIKKTYSLVKL